MKVESLDVPMVDFNGDGKVDLQDLLKMIRYWGQNEPSVDLSANGTVDRDDLEILMEYWQRDVSDVTLVSHWALDEAQGTVASDSTGLRDAALVGSPAWDPDGGRIDGALRLDGVDDYAVAPSVGDPAFAGPLSVFAWVKGGAPGQVLVSQTARMNLMLAEPITGCLMTQVQSGGRSSSALCSETVITDGDWHRVGLTLDGATRSLYVDDVLVAEDTLNRRHTDFQSE